MEITMESTTWDEGQLLRPRSGDEAEHAKSALRGALRKVGWKGNDEDLEQWLGRLRVGGDCFFITYPRQQPNGEAGLAAAPVEDVAPRLPYESAFDRQLLERLEGMAELARSGRQRQLADDARRADTRCTQARLKKWFGRSPIERALLRLSHARPADSELLKALAAAIASEPREPKMTTYGEIAEQLPDGGVDLAK